MPYDKPSDVPDSVPEDKKAQFMEVWNSAYKKAKDDGKSDKDAEEIAFKEAWGVIEKEKKSMPTPKLERRMFHAQLRTKQEDGKRKMVGYAAVFNSDSEDLGGFKERIKPGAFSRALNEKQDVRALKNHDPNLVLGRTKSGTLALKEDENGLNVDCDLPDTTYSRDLAVSLDRGDIDQMSFGFYTREEKWYDERGNEVPAWRGCLREIHDADLFDVSAVTFPAYTATSVEARTQFLFPEGKPGETSGTKVGTLFVDVRAAGSLRAEAKTKKVDGEDLGPHDFIVASDPQDTSTWHLPWHFSSEGKTLTHLRDALARFNQTDFGAGVDKEKAYEKLVHLCKAHGIQVEGEENKSAPQISEELALARAKTRMAEIKAGHKVPVAA